MSAHSNRLVADLVHAVFHRTADCERAHRALLDYIHGVETKPPAEPSPAPAPDDDSHLPNTMKVPVWVKREPMPPARPAPPDPWGDGR